MNYENKIKNVLQVIYEASQGDMTQVDKSYLEALDYEYSDGSVCRISEFAENIDTFDSFDEFWEYVQPLIKGNPEGEWSMPLSFAEGDDEAMLKEVIGTVYLEGVANVSDKNRKRLSEANNFGFNSEKQRWEGFFQGDNGKVFEYSISKKSGKWGIQYKLAA